ncbi:MAG: AraC family transcriptional regulator [Spirochaetales bacterium]|nr:AraC family transcriptional regulator [Spirochaetales bacterium]
MSRKTHRKRSFFKRFLFSYIFILIFPVLTAILFYNESVDSVYEEAVAANKAIIGQTTLILDESLEDAVALVARLNLDDDFNSLAYSERPLDGRFYYKMAGVVKNLNSHILTRAFFAGYFVYLPESGQVLVNNTSYEGGFFFDRMIDYGNYTKEDWLRNLKGERHMLTFLPADTFHLEGYQVNRIPVLIRFPIHYKPGTYCLVVIFLNNDIFNEYLSRVQISEDVSIYVSTREGVPITRLGGSEEEFALISDEAGSEEGERISTRDGRKLMVTVHSDYSDLTYRVLTPEPVLLHRLHYIRNMAMVISSFTLLVGILLSLFFSSRNAKPLSKIQDVLRNTSADEEGEIRDPFETLQNSISSLVSDNSSLNDRVAMQRAHLREMTLLRILNGEFKNLQDIKRSIDFLSLNIAADLYTVVCINLFPSEESQSMNTVEEGLLGRLLLDELLLQHECSCRIHIITLGESEYSLIFSWNDQSADESRGTTERLMKESVEILRREYGLIPVWGGGTFVDSLELMSQSYDNARDVLNRIDTDRSGQGRWYIPSERNTTDIHYSLEVENRILYLARAGEYDSFLTVYKSNIEKNSHLFHDRKLRGYYFDLLRNTFYRMDLNNSLFSELCLKMQGIDVSREADLVVEEIREVYSEICRFISDNKKSRNDRLKDEILDYLRENYRDINISLISVSSRFNMSSGYLSHFFKEQTGTNFSTYLEDFRIGKAIEILERENRKIQDLIEDVGYSNVYSFRRAFKKITGLSPSQYRDR